MKIFFIAFRNIGVCTKDLLDETVCYYNIHIIIVQFCGSVTVYAAFSLFTFASFVVVFVLLLVILTLLECN